MLILACLTVIVTISSCKRTYIYYFAPKESTEPVDSVVGGHVFLHYFLDATESMGGFTTKGENSTYVQALDFIWKTGNHFWKDTGDSRFYQCWISSIYQTSEEVWRSEAKTNRITSNNMRYYGTGILQNRVWNTNVRKGPFGSVIDYIEVLNSRNSNTDYKCLYVVISDMHEQGREYDVFSSFFRMAYKYNQSGAFFAVNSEFEGISYRANVLGEDIPVDLIDGESTFFIFIAGSRNEVFLYSERLAQDFQKEGVVFNHVIFIPNSDLNKTASWTPENFEMTSEIENEFTLFNCIPFTYRRIPLMLYQWEHNTNIGGYDAVQLNNELMNIYKLEQHDIAQYFAGLPIQVYQKDHYDYFDYKVELSILQYLNLKDTPVPGQSSESIDITGKSFFMPRSVLAIKAPNELRNNNYPLYITIAIDNKNISPGFYHVNYKIIRIAKVPDWVTQKSVSSIVDFENSINTEKIIKIIGFDNIYRNIIEEYNQSISGSIYSGDVYFIKERGFL
jgi:hypothetical protein